jgi:hypothetical protein
LRNGAVAQAFDRIKATRVNATLAGKPENLFLICSNASGTLRQFIFRSFR